MSEGQSHAHPNYLAVWVYLLVLTVVELGVAFLPWSKQVLLLTLLAMAIWKALLVALFFMHLTWERNRMRTSAIAPPPVTALTESARRPVGYYTTFGAKPEASGTGRSREIHRRNPMRLIGTLSATVLAAVLVVGCTDSTDSGHVSEDDLVGVWNATQFLLTSTADPR